MDGQREIEGNKKDRAGQSRATEMAREGGNREMEKMRG